MAIPAEAATGSRPPPAQPPISEPGVAVPVPPEYRVAVYVFEGVAPPETLIAVSLVLSAGLIALRAAMGALFAREFMREALAPDGGAP